MRSPRTPKKKSKVCFPFRIGDTKWGTGSRPSFVDASHDGLRSMPGRAQACSRYRLENREAALGRPPRQTLNSPAPLSDGWADSAAVKRSEVRIRCFVMIALTECRRRALLNTELQCWAARTERASAWAGTAFVGAGDLLVRITERVIAAVGQNRFATECPYRGAAE
jgi:hypothetical protein